MSSDKSLLESKNFRITFLASAVLQCMNTDQFVNLSDEFVNPFAHDLVQILAVFLIPLSPELFILVKRIVALVTELLVALSCLVGECQQLNISVHFKEHFSWILFVFTTGLSFFDLEIPFLHEIDCSRTATNLHQLADPREVLHGQLPSLGLFSLDITACCDNSREEVTVRGRLFRLTQR